MKNPAGNKTVFFAAVALASTVVVPLAHAGSNPFSNTELASGFNLDSAAGTKSGGEGKCGDASKCPEGTCGEGKCGEKCANKNSAGDKAISDDKKAAEGKCGEGACGEDMQHVEGKEKSAK